jgi:hypothetical protein
VDAPLSSDGGRIWDDEPVRDDSDSDDSDSGCWVCARLEVKFAAMNEKNSLLEEEIAAVNERNRLLEAENASLRKARLTDLFSGSDDDE